MPKSAPAHQTVETLHDLERRVRELLPGQLADADEIHIKRWGSLDPDYTYSWFESLAYALNAEMVRGVRQARFSAVANLMTQVLRDCTPEVRNCIDVAFVENLFWQVSPDKATECWHVLPGPLKDLYIGFHGCTPFRA